MNIICKVWGHDEVYDSQWPVSECQRCGVEMSRYGQEFDPLPSWNLRRLWLYLKYWLHDTWKGLFWFVENKYKSARYGKDWDIPF